MVTLLCDPSDTLCYFSLKILSERHLAKIRGLYNGKKIVNDRRSTNKKLENARLNISHYN